MKFKILHDNKGDEYCKCLTCGSLTASFQIIGESGELVASSCQDCGEEEIELVTF